jgi:quinol monooxygenase YgiN
MPVTRRHLVAAIAGVSMSQPVWPKSTQGSTMYGLIGKMTAKPGKRSELSAILIAGISGMPGCLSYIVANDPCDPDLLWITEVWETKEMHRASLSLPSVKEAITKGRPLIAAMDSVAETLPIGGQRIKVRK